MYTKHLLLCIVVIGWLTTAAPAGPGQVGTSVTYQGRLTDAGEPVNDAADLEFMLYDAETDGELVGMYKTFGTPVVDGLFSVDLDFGEGVFQGDARWLEITVHLKSGGDWITLSPRQPIRPAPYALYALDAAGGGSGESPWELSGSNIYYDSGNVGIGTASPLYPLHVVSTGIHSVYGETNATVGHAVQGMATAISGTNEGVWGQSNSASGRGVYGHGASGSGQAVGVLGETLSPDGYGIWGYNDADQGHMKAIGVYGSTNSPGGIGVKGSAPGDGGCALWGRADGTSGSGLLAEAVAQSGATYGVNAYAASPDGYGVYAFNEAESGHAYALYGETASPDGIAVYGQAGNDSEYSTGIGVYGISASSYQGTGVYGKAMNTGNTYGVHGVSVHGIGVRGDNEDSANYGSLGTSTAGVYGRSISTSGHGVFGEAAATSGGTIGVYGRSTSASGRGVFGEATATSGVPIGVEAYVQSSNGRGVYAFNEAESGDAIAVLGETASSSGIALKGSSSWGGTGVLGWADGATGRGVVGQAGDPNGFAGYFLGRGYFSANVGIGTASPSYPLHVVRANGATPIAGECPSEGTYGYLGYEGAGVHGEGPTGVSAIGTYDGVYAEGDLHAIYGNGGEYGVYGEGSQGVFGYSADTVGVGVKGHAVGEMGHGVIGLAEGSEGIGVYANANGPSGTGIEARGTFAAAKLYGRVNVYDYDTGALVIELGTGLDYAEGFDVSSDTSIAPGTVLVIDPANPGQLAVSTQPYDHKVAGIVAGANGLGSGVRLGSGEYDHDVALAGRVYCNVLATAQPVEPGDLLTTSDVPGYAMKVADHERARGAILGKAMQRLEKGEKGQILVLVTLQ